MQGARPRPWWLPRASRATPQTPQRTDPPARPNTMVALEQSALPTLRDRADFPSCGVVASLLGIYPTASAPPPLSGNLPRSRPRRLLSQAPGIYFARHAHPFSGGLTWLTNDILFRGASSPRSPWPPESAPLPG